MLRKSYGFDVNVHEFLLWEVDAFVQIVILTSIDNFLNDEPFIDEYFVFVFERIACFSQLGINAWKEHLNWWIVGRSNYYN